MHLSLNVCCIMEEKRSRNVLSSHVGYLFIDDRKDMILRCLVSVTESEVERRVLSVCPDWRIRSVIQSLGTR